MRAATLAVASILGLAAMPPASAQGGRMFTYEASQRLRTAADTCLKDEVMNGAYCLKQCQADFNLDIKAKPPLCIATRADAKYVPPKQWQPKEKAPAKPVPGS